jgi:hypothetical protein
LNVQLRSVALRNVAVVVHHLTGFVFQARLEGAGRLVSAVRPNLGGATRLLVAGALAANGVVRWPLLSAHSNYLLAAVFLGHQVLLLLLLLLLQNLLLRSLGDSSDATDVGQVNLVSSA